MPVQQNHLDDSVVSFSDQPANEAEILALNSAYLAIMKKFHDKTKESVGNNLDDILQQICQEDIIQSQHAQAMSLHWAWLDHLKKDYYKRYPKEKPSDSPFLDAMEAGKWHTVISNSLHSPEAFAQGFFGCLIGSSAVFVGMSLGTALRKGIDHHRSIHFAPLTDKEYRALCLLVYQKVIEAGILQESDSALQDIYSSMFETEEWQNSQEALANLYAQRTSDCNGIFKALEFCYQSIDTTADRQSHVYGVLEALAIRNLLSTDKKAALNRYQELTQKLRNDLQSQKLQESVCKDLKAVHDGSKPLLFTAKLIGESCFAGFELFIECVQNYIITNPKELTPQQRLQQQSMHNRR